MAADPRAAAPDERSIAAPDERSTAAPANSGWRARLALDFRRAHGRTVAGRRHEGPLCIQRPFYPGDGACHVYVLHPPGGLAGGDRVALSCAAETGAAALVTTPAATKFYRSLGPWSVQEQAIRVAPDASLEWLPLDSILFGGSRARISTRIRLASTSRFIGWEMTCLGRELYGDRYAAAGAELGTEIVVDGKARLLERTMLESGDAVLERSWGLAGRRVLGTLYAYPADASAVAPARARLDAATALTAGATRVDGVVVVRALAADAEPLRAAFESIWAALREAVVGLAPSAPRIWRT